jgi:hypothetical protein
MSLIIEFIDINRQADSDLFCDPPCQHNKVLHHHLLIMGPLHNVLIPPVGKILSSDITVILKDLDLKIGEMKKVMKTIHEMKFSWVICCSLHLGCK